MEFDRLVEHIAHQPTGTRHKSSGSNSACKLTASEPSAIAAGATAVAASAAAAVCAAAHTAASMGSIYQHLEPVDLSECFDQPLPLGPDGLLHGTLDNGLKWVAA